MQKRILIPPTSIHTASTVSKKFLKMMHIFVTPTYGFSPIFKGLFNRLETLVRYILAFCIKKCPHTYITQSKSRQKKGPHTKRIQYA